MIAPFTPGDRIRCTSTPSDATVYRRAVADRWVLTVVDVLDIYAGWKVQAETEHGIGLVFFTGVDKLEKIDE